MTIFPFPLRPGQCVFLTLPTDLTHQEVDKIVAYMESLVLPELTDKD